MAEVEGSDGNQYNIPDFAMEDTQEKILATLKANFKLDNNQINTAREALKAGKEGDKAQIEAIKKLGGDISKSLDGKGSLLGATGKAISGVTSGLTTLAGGALKLGGIVGSLGVAFAGLALDITRGFGGDLKKAGLAETGAAFGSLGAELNTLVPGLMTLGLSVEDAAGAINDFRGAMTVTSGKAIQGVITEFNRLTNGGAMYGRTLAENLDYLSEEIEYRTRLGFIDNQTRMTAAKDAKEIMDSQISASKLLGKTIEEISQGVKTLFSDVDIGAALARAGPVVEKELRMAFQMLDGAGLPDDFQAGLAKMITDPVMLASEEGQRVFNALQKLPEGIGDDALDSLENLRDAIATDDPDKIREAQQEFTKATLGLGPKIKDLGDEYDGLLLNLGRTDPVLQGLVANSLSLAQASENYNQEAINRQQALNDSLKDSVLFDNQLQILMNIFNVLGTSLKAGFAPALKNLTDALGDIADPSSPIGSFQKKIKEISEKFTKELNNLLGVTGGLTTGSDTARSVLDTFAEYVQKAADGVLELVKMFQNAEGENFMDKIGNFMIDAFKKLVSIVGAQFSKINWLDLIFGDSDDEIVENSAGAVDKARKDNAAMGGSDEYKAELLQGTLDAATSKIVERAQEQEYDASKTLQMIQDAGIEITELSGKRLQEIFPDPEELKTAISSVYGDDMESANAAWADVSKRIGERTQEIVDQDQSLAGFVKSGFETDEETLARTTGNVESRNAWADAATTKLEKVADELMPLGSGVLKDDGAEEVSKPEPLDTPPYALEEVLKPEPLGTPPALSAANKVITSTPDDEETSAENPTSTDGTKTQAVKQTPIGGTDESEFVKQLLDSNLRLESLFSNIDKNTKATAQAAMSTASNTS